MRPAVPLQTSTWTEPTWHLNAARRSTIGESSRVVDEEKNFAIVQVLFSIFEVQHIAFKTASIQIYRSTYASQ